MIINNGIFNLTSFANESQDLTNNTIKKEKKYSRNYVSYNDEYIL